MGASLFTNASAQTALQTLSAASKSLSNTQNRVSTGYRINTAEDNAAYWSIATTLRSDVKALGAVEDALGLGAATIDTVYTGINNTKDLLDEIKSKLVTASQSGVPRAQVQAEITQLQNRLKDVSKSTVINSESWLTQDSSAAGYNNIKNVVGSFTRTGGAISLDNINIDISGTKLYENSTTAQSAVTAALNDSTAGALKDYTDAFASAADVTGISSGDWTTAVTAVDTAVKALIVGLPTATEIVATTTTQAQFTTFRDTTVSGLTAATVTSGAIDTALVAAFTTASNADAAALIRDAITPAAKNTLTVAVQDALNAYKTAIAALPDTAGATATGPEADAANNLNIAFRTAVATAVGNMLGQTSVTAAATASIGDTARKAYEAAAKADTDNANLGIFDKVRTVVSNADGTGAKAVRVSEIDISKLTDTEFDRGILTSYLKATDDALQELTLSASVIGAAKSRVEGNKTFVKNLVDANNRGIGQLVDADLNEESAKLKALQTQEQLAIQALGIANSSSQNILRLFQ